MKHSPYKQRHSGLTLTMRFNQEVVIECGEEKIILQLQTVGSNQARVKFVCDESVRIRREEIAVSKDRLAALMREVSQ